MRISDWSSDVCSSDLADDITWFLAPYVNSYKRFQAGTFAPTKAIWSLDNRTAGFRLCGEGSKAIRIECRIGGGDLNPYLAFSALLAAGLAGIEAKLELPEPRSEERRVGTECVSTCRSRWSPYHYKKK